MPTLRVIHINQADLATSLAASTTIGTLVAAYMLTDRKGSDRSEATCSMNRAFVWASVVMIPFPAGWRCPALRSWRAGASISATRAGLSSHRGPLTGPGRLGAPWTRVAG